MPSTPKRPARARGRREAETAPPVAAAAEPIAPTATADRPDEGGGIAAPASDPPASTTPAPAAPAPVAAARAAGAQAAGAPAAAVPAAAAPVVPGPAAPGPTAPGPSPSLNISALKDMSIQ